MSVSTWKKETLNIRYENIQTATDKVPHQRLLKKSSCPCDRRKVLLLIISRLKDKKQKVGLIWWSFFRAEATLVGSQGIQAGRFTL